ncbi:MAG TPA: trigger factor [Thermomicrobiales bacterium]|nr:trigger factor [Thermomicrobiales bacterium]
MNVVTERLPESQVVLDITTDEQEFEKALERAYRKVVQQVRLPGFRPGKAPRRIIEQLLGREVLIEQAGRDLLDPLYQQALEREDLRPVSDPDVEIYQAEPLAFKVTVQVYPAIDPGNYQGVRVEPRHVEVADEQVDEAVARLRAQQSPWEEPAEPRPAREGDRVTLDVEVREGDQEFRAPLKDGVFTLGQDTLLPALREALLGMGVGDERDVPITFAVDDEQAEPDMRGKTLDYHLALTKIEEQHLVDLDDEFAGTASSGRAATVDALRAEVRQSLLDAERQKARGEVGTEVVNALGEVAAVELPPALVERQIDTEIENLRTHLSQSHGQTLEAHLRLENKTQEQLREETRAEATRRLRNSLVLREIATREGVSVGPQDVDAEIERLLGPDADPNLRQVYSGNYIRELLENELFERLLMDRVIALATEGRGAFEPPAEPAEEPAAAEGAEEPVAEAAAPAAEGDETPVAEEAAPAAEPAEEGDTTPLAAADADAGPVAAAPDGAPAETAEALAEAAPPAPDAEPDEAPTPGVAGLY